MRILIPRGDHHFRQEAMVRLPYCEEPLPAQHAALAPLVAFGKGTHPTQAEETNCKLPTFPGSCDRMNPDVAISHSAACSFCHI